MSQRRNRLGLRRLAHGAGVCLDAGLLAGRGSCHCSAVPAVALRVGVVIFVTVAALRTGILRIAFFCTSRRDNRCSVGMRMTANCHIACVKRVANRTCMCLQRRNYCRKARRKASRTIQRRIIEDSSFISVSKKPPFCFKIVQAVEACTPRSTSYYPKVEVRSRAVSSCSSCRNFFTDCHISAGFSETAEMLIVRVIGVS